MRASRVVICAVAALAACGGSETSARGASTSVRGSGAVSGARSPAVSAWDAAAGPALVVFTGPDPGDASLIAPEVADSASGARALRRAQAFESSTIDLFGRSGASGEAEVHGVAPADGGDGCAMWPTARLASPEPLPSWAIGLAHGSAAPVALDSIEHLSPGDSARLAADVTRLVSALPDDTLALFRGLPFTVRVAWRFTLQPATRVVVADVLRGLNEEANPREERIFVVAEDAGEGTAGWRAVWFERVSGAEESIASADVLAVLEVGPLRTPTIVLSRDAGSSTVYSLVQRQAPGIWRVRWTSAPSGC
jgi:hypothetical protein